MVSDDLFFSLYQRGEERAVLVQILEFSLTHRCCRCRPSSLATFRVSPKTLTRSRLTWVGIWRRDKLTFPQSQTLIQLPGSMFQGIRIN